MEPTRISAPQGGQGAQGTQSTRAKGNAQQAGGPVDPSAQGGFMALLAALDSAVPGDGAAPDSAGDPALLNADPASMAAWQGLLAPGAVPGSAATLGAGGVPGSDWLPSADGLVAQTAMLDGAADVSGVKPPGGAVAGYSRMFSRIQNALSQGGELPGSVAGVIGAEKKQALTMAAVAAAQGAQAVVDSRALGGSLPDAGLRDGRELPGGQGGAAPAFALDAFAESRVPQRAGSASSGDAGGRPSAEAAWADWGVAHTGPEAAGVDGAAAFADPTQVGAEEQVADQVAYWVNQKTQNAEMTLDRDGQPVQVTVSLSGSEAHVTFRSDQAQTRELLDSSMSQLRDLLRDEGLVLSGTTVGTTARDGASPNDSGQRQGREGERRTQVVASVPAAVATVRRPGDAPERAVDIFV
ncbi:flagellar hook-length control protein FliK [Acidovorax carolinensis]|nr:flagellar hook-length control protein FliK [Acidovorax carolinensis]